jgi:hypothetical protein
MRIAAALLALLALACSHGERRPASAPASAPSAARSPDGGPPASRPVVTNDPRYFVEAGAPDPLACDADKDCIADVIVDQTGCCVVPGEPLPQTWAWHTWLGERRMGDACRGVKCKPLPVPSMPRSCLLQVRCLSGRCADSCSDLAK